jgi:antitoxin VapB
MRKGVGKGRSLHHDAEHQERRSHRLARESADRTGETLTQAVITALREGLERSRPAPDDDDLIDDVLRLAARFSRPRVLDARTADEIVGYDEHGVPCQGTSTRNEHKVIDTSALIAILQKEPEAQSFTRAIVRDSRRLVSVMTALEAEMVAFGRAGEDGVALLELALHKLQGETVPCSLEQLASARRGIPAIRRRSVIPRASTWATASRRRPRA